MFFRALSRQQVQTMRSHTVDWVFLYRSHFSKRFASQVSYSWDCGRRWCCLDLVMLVVSNAGFFFYCIFHLFCIRFLRTIWATVYCSTGLRIPYKSFDTWKKNKLGSTKSVSAQWILYLCLRVFLLFVFVTMAMELESVVGAFTSLSHHILISVVCNGCYVISWLVLMARIQQPRPHIEFVVALRIQRYNSMKFIRSGPSTDFDRPGHEIFICAQLILFIIRWASDKLLVRDRTNHNKCARILFVETQTIIDRSALANADIIISRRS